MKIDLGCGRKPRDGFLGVDLDSHCQPQICADICKPIPGLADNCADEINCSHVLEHLPGSDWRLALSEMARLLKTGGTVLIRIPHPGSECAMVNGHLGVLTPRWWRDMQRDNWLRGELLIDTVVERQSQAAIDAGVFDANDPLMARLRPFLWDIYVETVVTAHKP